jgi:hypothetical protein
MFTTDLVANHQVYPYRAAFGAPEIPAAAQEALEVGGYAIYAVYPPNDTLTQTAP